MVARHARGRAVDSRQDLGRPNAAARSAMAIPELAFPPWVPWESRRRLPLVRLPGVYLLSITTESLTGNALQWDDVSYIGMTNSIGGLASRWRQFDRAIRGKGGHSGGNKVFRILGHREAWEVDLFVTGMTIPCDVRRSASEDLRQMGLVASLEYEAFAQYQEEVGGKPRFNTK